MIKNYIKKSLHRNQLEKLLKSNLPHLLGSILDIGSKNRRYDYLLKTKPTSIDLVENKGKDVSFGDVVNLSFPDSAFDCVVCIEVLEYVDNPLKAISEISRVLKSGGVLVLSVPFMYKQHDDMLRYTDNYLKKELLKYFSSVSMLPIGNSYTIILDILKDRINRINLKFIRYIFYILYLPFALISIITSPSGNGFVSGYFVVAKK